MGHVSLNIFETFTAFNLINKQSQAMTENLSLIEEQNQKIAEHQSVIDVRLDELEYYLIKLKELKGKKRLQLGFSIGKERDE
jgi:uncharacterized coiled-coil protein SlyX